MKVIFISNFFSHHQKPFCDHMFSLLGKDFTFVATQTISEERVSIHSLLEAVIEEVLLNKRRLIPNK